MGLIGRMLAASALCVVAACAAAGPGPSSPQTADARQAAEPAPYENTLKDAPRNQAGPAPVDGPVQTRFSGPALDFTPEPGKDFGDQTAFTRSVAQRYRAPSPIAMLTDDLKAFGMACSPFTGIPPSPTMPLMDCGRVEEAGGSCFDSFAVTLFKAPGDGMARVDDARYARRCLGALPSR